MTAAPTVDIPLLLKPKERAAVRVRLTAIGKEITVRLGKADKHELGRDDMLTSVNELLKEAKQLCADGQAMSFEAFKDKFCPTLGKSVAYELRAQILGTKTKKQLLLANKQRQQKHRDKVKRAKTDRFRYVTENSPLANKTVALLPDNSVVVIPAKPVPAGNDTDASAAAAKSAQTENAKLQGVTSPASKSWNDDITTKIAEKDARSKMALIRFNAAIDAAINEWLPEMNTTEKQSAFGYFEHHPKMKGVKRKAT